MATIIVLVLLSCSLLAGGFYQQQIHGRSPGQFIDNNPQSNYYYNPYLLELFYMAKSFKLEHKFGSEQSDDDGDDDIHQSRSLFNKKNVANHRPDKRILFFPSGYVSSLLNLVPSLITTATALTITASTTVTSSVTIASFMSCIGVSQFTIIGGITQTASCVATNNRKRSIQLDESIQPSSPIDEYVIKLL